MLQFDGLCEHFHNDVGLSSWCMDEYLGIRHGLLRQFLCRLCSLCHVSLAALVLTNSGGSWLSCNRGLR